MITDQEHAILTAIHYCQQSRRHLPVSPVPPDEVLFFVQDYRTAGFSDDEILQLLNAALRDSNIRESLFT